MRRFFDLILMLCLFACLAGGATAHAAELAEGGGIAAAEGQHVDGDHDPSPDGTDKNVPHHHSICHGHDLAAAAKAGFPPLFAGAVLPRPATDAPPRGAAPGSLLRPPIA